MGAAKKGEKALSHEDFIVKKASRLFLEYPKQHFYNVEWSFDSHTTVGIDMHIAIETVPTPRVHRQVNVSVYGAYVIHYNKDFSDSGEIILSNETVSEKIKKNIENLLN